MVKQLPINPGALPIVQSALRAAVHAPSEREGFDLLADALRKVSELTAAAAVEQGALR
jgi:uncharacterized protein HemY